MSPSGIDAFQKHQGVISARRNSQSEQQRPDFFKIEDGQVARVRFLEQGSDLTWAQTHRLRVSWSPWPQDILCLDQDDDGSRCPACQSDNPAVRSRSTKGFVNVIWRGTEDEGFTRAPVYKLNEKGYPEKDANKQKIITGFEDSVWLWKCSKSVFEQILEKDGSYKGAMSRDFKIKRKGATKDNTVYFVEPAVVDGGPEPMTVADNALAQKKFDVVALTTPGTYDEMQALVTGQQQVAGNGGPQETFPREAPSQDGVFNDGPAVRSSAFGK